MFNPKELHIMIASDSNYSEFVAATLESLFDANSLNFDKLFVHLFSNGIDDISLARISKSIPSKKAELKVYDICDIKERLCIGDGDTMPVCSYARLLLTEYLHPDVSRILYVDCDVIFNGGIKEFWNCDMGDNWIAGVLDAHMNSKPKTMIGMPEDAAYVNAGVLLINLDAWRENKIVGKFQRFIDSYNGLVYHQDQGIINRVCNGHIMILPPKYNALSYFYSHPYKVLLATNTPFYSKDEITEAKNNPVMIHFTEGYFGRPWKEHCKHPKKNVFLKYYERTEWKGQQLQKDNRSWPQRISSWMFLHLPYGLYNALMKGLFKLF